MGIKRISIAAFSSNGSSKWAHFRYKCSWKIAILRKIFIQIFIKSQLNPSISPPEARGFGGGAPIPHSQLNSTISPPEARGFGGGAPIPHFQLNSTISPPEARGFGGGSPHSTFTTQLDNLTAGGPGVWGREPPFHTSK